MWVHLIILILFVILFVRSKGFFSKSGQFLTTVFSPYIPLQKKEIRIILILLFWTNLCGALVTWSEQEIRTLAYLERQEPGNEAYTEEVELYIGDKKENIEIQVEPQEYTKEEVQKQMQEAPAKISALILGENKSMEHVDHDLNLIEAIPGTGIRVSWESDYPEYIDWEGRLTAQIPEEGAAICLTAELSCQEEMRTYKQYLTVYPSVQTDHELLQEQVKEAVAQKNDPTDKKLVLPDEVLEQKVRWGREATHLGWILTGVGICAGIFYGARRKNQDKTENEKRRKQMDLDYPQIVNKLVLLMNAGMSMRGAFSRIAVEYQKSVQEGKERRYAYDELLVTYHEMESGVLETDAYGRFGERCDNLHYKTFTTLLVQNIRKGSRELVQMLEREALEAFEERKARARVLGEEAGTRLLFPMILMFVLVIVILMIPAYLSF